MLWGRWVPSGRSLNNQTVKKVIESWKAIGPKTLFTHRWFSSCGGAQAELPGYFWDELGQWGNVTKGSGWSFVKIINCPERRTPILRLMTWRIDGKSIFYVHFRMYAAMHIWPLPSGLNVFFHTQALNAYLNIKIKSQIFFVNLS